jgi:hypothetical protein
VRRYLANKAIRFAGFYSVRGDRQKALEMLSFADAGSLPAGHALGVRLLAQVAPMVPTVRDAFRRARHAGKWMSRRVYESSS